MYGNYFAVIASILSPNSGPERVKFAGPEKNGAAGED